MSEPKRLVSFRDLAKAKPQAKDNQGVEQTKASATGIAASSVKPSSELVAEPSTASPAEQPEIPIAKASAVLSVTASTEQATVPFAAPSVMLSTAPSAAPFVKPSEIGYPEPSAKPSEGRAEPYQTLESTHTGSEQKLYGFLYRETVSKGKRVFQATQPYLRSKTGISGPNTLRRAIRGLEDKLCVRVLNIATGDRAGTEYYVFTPKEITTARREAGIEIHPVTKYIRVQNPEASAEGFTKPSRERLRAASVERSAGRAPTGLGLDRPRPSETALHDKYNINPNGPDKPSSVPQQGSDDEKLPKVRKLFEQLSNGGSWKDERDMKAYQDIADINLFHITLGLCYSVSKSPEHKMSSLAYAVPSIQQHAADMDEFSPTTLEEIAYRTKRKTMNCIAEGKWSIPDWETGKE